MDNNLKHKKKYIWLTGGVIVLLLVIVGISLYFYFKQKEEEEAKALFTDIIVYMIDLEASSKIPVKDPEYSNDDITLEDARQIFLEKRALVVGDSMAEGLTAYGVLDPSNVIWTRGRRIDMISEDMPKITLYQPNYLFLSCGSNDLELWVGNVDGFIRSYKTAINNIKSTLPNAEIIINSILPVSKEAENNNNAFSYQELFNTKLKEMADEMEIAFLENSQYLKKEENPYSSDGIHPKAFFFRE